jgi:hypothetical protein
VRFKLPAMLLALLLLPLLPNTARAQNKRESWEIGPYVVATDYDSLTEINDNEGFGFRFGYNFTNLHEFETFLDTVSTHDNVTGQIDVRQGELGANYVFNFNFQRHQVAIPYFTAGLGFIRFATSAPGAGSADELDSMWNWGGGVRFFFGKMFNLRLDFRAIYYHGGNDILPYYYFQNNEFSLGVGWVLPVSSHHRP